MEWSSGDRSDIEDRRGASGGFVAPLGIGGLIVLALLSWFTGFDFLSLVGRGGPTVAPSASAARGTGRVASTPEEERLVDFVDAVMRDTQGTWNGLLAGGYEPTKAVLFRDATPSGCGTAQSATGPFYCPQDRKVYLDLGFFDDLRQRFGAPGDFAQAYVIAHEVGHHVQTLQGIEQRVRQEQRADPRSVNALSVKLELQADCYAGVWGRAASEPGRAAQGKVQVHPDDIDAGLQAAAAIGDDRLQRMSTGRVMLDRFTHGTSEQRVTWFRRGFESGDPKACNTFQ